ncbi:DUF4124 domain-containing protein [Oceanicoccus sp. KOV_DT_Chl]|uniref:DUF4124 domain-containing protein n=1 Tax=Oceanicoccus sp. KOV_DT_Chl TaxID=1904639 RepID=UPI000C7D2FEB|nr:DUF4124 domain-containing protein [Oceanicoccus sp. KOV_DT_Chl]
MSLTQHLLFLVTTLCLLAALSLQAAPNGLYRWTDADGTVQYSDYPPEGVEAEFIKYTGASSQGKSSTTEKKTETAETAANQGAEPSKLEVMPDKDPVLCKQAQANLKALEGARIRITEPDGSKRFLTEEEKEGQRENARKFIKINC